MHERLEISTLGGLHIKLDGERLDLLGTRKVEGILVYLAATGRPIPREVLAEMFWSDRSHSLALSNLRVALSSLRKYLAPFVTITREMVSINGSSDVWMDIRALETDLVEASKLERMFGRLSPDIISKIESAVALYHGEFLPGFFLRDARDFDAWTTVERERLQKNVMEGLAKLVDWHLKAAAYLTGLDYARRWLQLDPLMETAQQQMMRLLAYNGQTAAALSHYESFVTRLKDEIGVEPMPSTIALYQAIKDQRVPPPARSSQEQGLVEGPSADVPFKQEIRFCLSKDGVRIAYATAGSGPPFVKAADSINHLEHDWNSPIWLHWYKAYAAHHTLVRYDRRGFGLSDRDILDQSLDAWVTDLEAVVEATGADRFPIVGMSQGSTVCVEYAFRHPDRVSHIIIVGGFARGWLKRDPYPGQYEEAEMYRIVTRHGWGKDSPAFRQLFTSLYIPEGTPEMMAWFNELERLSASPEVAVALLDAGYVINITESARQVKAPALIFHAEGDATVPFEQGLELASLIPNSRFVPLKSKNHVLLPDEPAWKRFLSELYRFLDITN